MFRLCDHHQGAALFLAKITLLKHSLIDFPIIIWCCGSMSYCVGPSSLRVCLTMCVVCYAARDCYSLCMCLVYHS